MDEKKLAKLLNLTIKKREFDVLIEQFGFTKRQGKGSHERWHKTGLALTVATHDKEVPVYILKQVIRYLRDSGII